MNAVLQDWSSDTPQFDFDHYHVEKIPRKPAEDFIREYHYARGCSNSTMPWGLYEQGAGTLIGVIAFSVPISENARADIFEDIDGPASENIDYCDCDQIEEKHGYRKHVTNLQRMAIHPNAPKNTATWFISRALKGLKKHAPKYWAVTSFADTTEGHDGTVYQAANADYYGMTEPEVFYKTPSGRLRSRKQDSSYGEHNISREEAKELGWEIVKRKAKHKYIFWLPGPYQSKDDLREMSTIELQDYPESDSALD